MLRKWIPVLALVLVFFVLLSAILVSAWFAYIRDSMVLVAGDIHIEVETARYAYAHMTEDSREELLSDKEGNVFYELDRARLNTVPISSEDSYVIYEFTLRNTSPTDAMLALRLSEYASYLYREIGSFDPSAPELTIPFQNYTANQILQIKYLRYSYNAAEPGIDPNDVEWVESTRDANANMHLWNYSYGNYIFGEGALFAPIRLDAALDPEESSETSETSETSEPTPATERHSTVTIRLAIEENFDSDFIREYYDWITQENGYIWNCCKNALQGQADADTLIRAYLDCVKEGEQTALNDALRSDLGTGDGFQLTFNYFEFVGENIPYNDSVTIQ